MSAFDDAAASLTQQICTYLEIAWNDALVTTINDGRGATGWSDESAYLLTHSGDYKIASPGDQLVAAGEIGTLQLTLDNTSLRYSWQNPASPLYSYIGGLVGMAGKPVRLWQGFIIDGVAQYVCIFTGVIVSFTPSTVAATLQLECKDWGQRFLQDKRSSLVARNQLPNEWMQTLCTTVGISALLDVGIYRIPFCWLDDESIVAEIWQAAEVDGGLAYFDQSGVLRFENALHWLTHDTPVWSFSEDDYARDDPDMNLDAVATKVIVEWAPRYVGPEQVIYTSDSVKVIAPGASETWTARFTNAVLSVIQPVNTSFNTDYRAQSSGGASMTSFLTVTLSNTCAQQTTVTIHNSSTRVAARLVLFQIRGQPLLGGPTEQIEKLPAAPPFPYERSRSIRDNPYLQTRAQANALASALAVRCGQIRPLYKLDLTYGIPQLRPSDLVSFRDVRAQGADNLKQGVILGIHWEGGIQSGFKQSLQILDISGLTQYAYDEFFIIGVTSLGAHGRCYY